MTPDPAVRHMLLTISAANFHHLDALATARDMKPPELVCDLIAGLLKLNPLPLAEPSRKQRKRRALGR